MTPALLLPRDGADVLCGINLDENNPIPPLFHQGRRWIDEYDGPKIVMSGRRAIQLWGLPHPGFARDLEQRHRAYTLPPIPANVERMTVHLSMTITAPASTATANRN